MGSVRTEGGFEVLKGVCAVLQGAIVLTAKIQCLCLGSEHLIFQEGAGRLEGTRELTVTSLRDYRYCFVED